MKVISMLNGMGVRMSWGTLRAPGQVGASQWVTCASTGEQGVPPATGEPPGRWDRVLRLAGRPSGRSVDRNPVGRNPQDAGMHGTSPEIPYTVEADPYPTGGKAAAAARPGQSGPASTGAPAVGTQGREAHGTRETPAPPRPPVGGAAREGNLSGGLQRWGVGSAHGTQGTGGKPRGGKGPTGQRGGAAAQGGHAEAQPQVPVAAPAPPP